MASTTINLGVIGLSAEGSWFSQAHLPYIQKSEDYRIIALQNSSKTAAEKSVEKYGLPKDTGCYDDVEALVADNRVRLVVVSLKVPNHFEKILPALKAKKDVFVEWPLARNLAEAEQLTRLAKEKGVRTMVGLQARQNPAIRKVKEMVDNGDLGDILGTTMNATGMILGATTQQNLLYIAPIENGANLLTIPAGHAMDALCYVLGEVKDLQATLANNRPTFQLVDADGKFIKDVQKTSHDYMAVTGHLQRGGVACIVYQGGLSQTGKNFYWEINGTRGSVVMEIEMGHLQMFHPTLKFVRAEMGAKLEVVEVEEAKDFAYNVGVAWDAFLGKGKGTVTTFEDALLRHRMLDAIYRSNEKGTRESYV